MTRRVLGYLEKREVTGMAWLAWLCSIFFGALFWVAFFVGIAANNNCVGCPALLFRPLFSMMVSFLSLVGFLASFVIWFWLIDFLLYKSRIFRVVRTPIYKNGDAFKEAEKE